MKRVISVDGACCCPFSLVNNPYIQTPQGLEALCHGLHLHRGMENVEFVGRLQFRLCIAVARITFALPCPSLTANKLGDAGVLAIAKALTHHRQLVTLRLGGNHVSVDGAMALAAELPPSVKVRLTGLFEGLRGWVRDVLALYRILWEHACSATLFLVQVIGVEGWDAAAVLAELRNGSATAINFDKDVTLQPSVLAPIVSRISHNFSLSRIRYGGCFMVALPPALVLIIGINFLRPLPPPLPLRPRRPLSASATSS